MFEALRKRQKTISSFILIGFAALLMASFGLESYSFQSAQPNAAIKVGEKEISSAEFYQEYQARADMYRRQLGSSFDQLKGIINIQQQTVDSIIENSVTEEFLNGSGLVAGVEQVEQELRKHPYFAGGFSQEKWRDFLRASGMNEQKLEELTQRQILQEQLSQTLGHLTTPGEKELKTLWQGKKQTASFQVAEFSGETFQSKVLENDPELESYFSENQEEYTEPRGVSARYVELKAKDYTSRVDVTDEDLALFFDENRVDYVEPKKARVSVVTVSLPAPKPASVTDLLPESGEKKEASESTISGREAADAALTAVVGKLNSDSFDPETAAEMAKRELQTVSGVQVTVKDPEWIEAIKGGGTELQSFVKRATYEKRAEQSTSENTATIFLAYEIKDAREKELSEVRTEVEQAFRADNAVVYLQADATELERELQSSSEDLVAFAKKRNLQLLETDGFIVAQGSLPEELSAAILTSQMGDRKKVLSGSSAFLLETTAIREPAVPPLEKIRARVFADFRREKGLRLAKEQATALLAEVATGASPIADFKKKSESLGATVTKSDSVNRTESTVPALSSETVRARAFALQEIGGVLPEVISAGSSHFVVQLEKRESTTSEATPAELIQLRAEATEASGSQNLRALIEAAKATETIWVNPELQSSL